MEKKNYVAKTMAGLEDLLADEIAKHGGVNIVKLHRAVSFDGDLRVLYKVNLWSRTALRVLQPFLHFKAHNETVLYKRIGRYDWTDLFSPDHTFKINSSVHSDRFNHSQYVALKTKDAIVDQFRERHGGIRPSIDLEDPDFVIDIHCNGIDFTISLDSSGESLHKRGYRQSKRKAPLNEVLAAGMILLSGWKGQVPLLDPMCGSGTLLTEALSIATNTAPRIRRNHYAFMEWKNYDPLLWKQVKSAAASQTTPPTVPIYGYDINSQQLAETKELLQLMGIGEEIKVESKDFFTSTRPEISGMIIVNPPYGQRIEADDIVGFYKRMGDTFKKQYEGWTAWVISGNKTAIKALGLRTSKKLTLYNGSIECKYHRYDMYQGSKKKKEVRG